MTDRDTTGEAGDLTEATASVSQPRVRGVRKVLPRGTAVGRYLILEEIGVGGMGVVYAAYDPDLDRRIAVKLMRAEEFDGRSKTRVLREAQAMARLSHPNVVSVYDVGLFEDQVFIAMELVDGTTLRRWLRSTPRSWEEIIRVMVDAGRGLEAAHQAGLVHRDVKPSNILVDRQQRARVMDFGVARAIDREGDEPVRSERTEPAGVLHAELTRAGTVVGTPAYMAPEQMRGVCDPRTDQYSFCVALYEALYGERPGDGDEVTSSLDSQPSAPPPHLPPQAPWLRHRERFMGARSRTPAALDASFTEPDDAMHTAPTRPGAPRRRATRPRRFSIHRTWRNLRARTSTGSHGPSGRQARGDAGSERSTEDGEPLRPEVRVPGWVQAAVLRGLAPDPAARYPSMKALLAELERDPQLRRRRAVTALAAATLLAGAAALAVAWGASREPPCPDAAAEFAAVWGPDTAARVVRSFDSTGRSYAAETALSLASLFEERGRDWGRMKNEACAATRVRGEQSERLLALRASCLDRRLAEARTLLEQLVDQVGETGVDRAVEAFAELPELARCADVDALSAVTPLPTDGATRDRVALLRERVARLNAMVRTGSDEAGLAQAPAVVDEARTLDYAPALAEALIALARLQAARGEFQSAETNYHRALEQAARAREHRVIAEISTELVELLGVRQARRDEALAIGALAEAQVARSGTAPIVRARLHARLGDVLLADGRAEAGLEHLSRARELFAQARGEEQFEVARADERMGDALLALGRRELAARSYERALHVGGRVLGATHPAIARIQAALAQCQAAP